MIPLRDTVPRRTFPAAVVGILAINVLVFLLQLSMSRGELFELFHLWGVVPARFTDPGWAALAGYPPGGWLAFVSYMFLHSGWLHIILNMWMLWIFADNVEDVTGHGGFVAFYLLCGLAAMGVQVAFEPGATVPVVGASGAIAGVLGAYFVLYPHGHVVTLIPIFLFPWIVRIPAVLFLGIWFALQVLSGLGSGRGMDSDIAWWAHAGGFVAGMLLIRVFRRAGHCTYCYNPATKGYEPDDLIPPR